MTSEAAKAIDLVREFLANEAELRSAGGDGEYFRSADKALEAFATILNAAEAQQREIERPRQELNRVSVMAHDSDLENSEFRKEIAEGVEPRSIPDGVEARNETIKLQGERIERLRKDILSTRDGKDEMEACWKREHKECAALRERLKVLTDLLRFVHDTLYEINMSNYDHDEVAELNSASVEAILSIAPVLGETHGKSPDWWRERAARALTPAAPTEETE